MSKRVYLARSPDRKKVTTINIKLGAHGIPYNWEYFVLDKDELPAGKLRDRWDELVVGKRVLLSTLNKEKISLKEVLVDNSRIENKIQSLMDHKQVMLNDLDIAFLRSMELPTQNKTYQQEAIGKFKTDLRDLNIMTTEFTSEKEFLEYWPEVFDRTVNDYIAIKPKKWLVWIGAGLVSAFIVIPLLIAIVSS